jgi:hypothetical protein
MISGRWSEGKMYWSTLQNSESPVTIAGPMKMKLFAATDGPDTDWMIKLLMFILMVGQCLSLKVF